jgi:hypothetical protein
MASGLRLGLYRSTLEGESLRPRFTGNVFREFCGGEARFAREAMLHHTWAVGQSLYKRDVHHATAFGTNKA